MGFVVTTPTDTPLTPAGTLDAATWGESGGPFAVPPEIGPGLGSVPLSSATYNYNAQAPARWTRALADQSVLSSEGLFTTCVVRAGFFNVADGNLNITLDPTRVVIDVDGNGGTVMEIYATLGSPEVLAPNTDNYVELDEAGGVNVLSVPNGNPAPAPTAGFVQVWKLITNGIELTNADLVDGISPVPCFNIVGATYIRPMALQIPDGGTITIDDGAISSAARWTVDELEITDTTPLLPADVGRIRRRETAYMVADAGGDRQRTLSDPRRGWVEGFGPAGGPTIATSTTRTIAFDEPVDITVEVHFSHDTAGGDLIIEVEANYTGSIGIQSILLTTCRAADIGGKYSAVIPKVWLPTDDFPALATTVVMAFFLSLGAPAGNIVADFARIRVESAIQT